MDPAQGETQGRSLTSKLKAKVKGVKGKVHLPGHKKRHGDAQGADNNDDDSYDSSSSDDSPKKPGPETGYNVGASTPYTTVKDTPLSPARSPPRRHHARFDEPPAATAAPPLAESYPRDYTSQTEQPYGTSATEGVPNPSSPSKPAPGVLGHVKETVGGAAAAVGSKMGYYAEVEHTPHVQPPTDPYAPTLVEKAKATLGMDKPSDPNAPTLMEKAKATLGMDKPSDPNAPTVMEKTKAALGLGPATGHATSPSTTSSTGTLHQQQQQPGIVDRVTGSMSSLFTSSPKKTGEDVQHTFPAHSDTVPYAGTLPTHSDTVPYAGGSGFGDERMSGGTVAYAGGERMSGGTVPYAGGSGFGDERMPGGTVPYAGGNGFGDVRMPGVPHPVIRQP